MNLLDILWVRIDTLPEGSYMLGLKAVLQHIEVAVKHLNRGQSNIDDTAFTDAIYRTNQAFEGSLKEAYRVLAGKDPNKVKPFEIENYFQQQNKLRPRVLAQFTNYRTQWRNPSTHDYRLNFDDDEALLAIVTVSAFAIVLIDQIKEQLSFEQGQAVAQPAPVISEQPLIYGIANLIELFTIEFSRIHAARPDVREAEILGALGGFLSKAAPQLNVNVETRISPDRPERLDMLIATPTERVIIELKRSRGTETQRRIREGISQVSNYMIISGIKEAIIFTYTFPNKGITTKREHKIDGINGRIIDITVEPSNE